MNPIAEVIFRLRQSSPELFKRIQQYSWVILVLAVVSWLLKAFGVYTLPEDVSDTLGLLIGVFFGSAVTASLPVDEKGAEALQKKKEAEQ